MNIFQSWRRKQAANSGKPRQFYFTHSITQIILILLLLIPLVWGAMPGYLQGGNWSWSRLPRVPHLQDIKSFLNTGLELPDWKIVQQKQIRVGGQIWSAQVMESVKLEQSKPVMLMLSPQSYYLDKPEVEWMDLNGLERWKTDSYRQLQFQDESNSNSQVKARFFRAWNPRQTFAVVQWYAFPNGGHYASGSWFWRDRVAQLRGSRVPWVATCLKIPLEPLGELNLAQPIAESLARQIQANLSKSMRDKE